MATRIQIAKPDIVALFQKRGQKVYRTAELTGILRENRAFWRLAQSQTLDAFLEFLVEKTSLRAVNLERGTGEHVVRFVWGEANAYELALSLAEGAYLSYGTAVFLHGLADQIPKTVYVNHEQAPKAKTTQRSELTQEIIDAAFQKPARETKDFYRIGDVKIVAVNGKHTGRLEVDAIEGPGGTKLQATLLERTLIDIAVRPIYGGGVYQVLEAFKAARSRLSVNVLAATLKRLDYAYPYHQAIGFYLQRAGYEVSRLELLKSLPREYDFYLTNAMAETDYDVSWRLFYPRGM